MTPDFDQEGKIRRAEAALAADGPTPRLAAAHTTYAWLDRGAGGAPGGCRNGGTRPPIRAALIRHWMRHGPLKR